MNTPKKILSVGEVIGRIQWLLEGDTVLNNLWVRGEISNFRAAGGHWYFTLKDTNTSIRCVMFRSRISRVGFLPQNGLRAVVKGYVSVFERDGGLTFYLDELLADGVGSLWASFQQLKERLESEGLFAAEKKRPLPFFPRVVGIATSPTGAAFQDMKTIIRRRCPASRIVLAPTIVQGPQAPAEIAAAVERLNLHPEVEVIIVGRGGGSLEELWAFNTEEVARAIRRSRLPVISAVGHETDVSISDLAADMRAATPSAAAEMVVPVLNDLLRQLTDLRSRFTAAFDQTLRQKREKLDSLAGRQVLKSPRGFLELRSRLLQQSTEQLKNAVQRILRFDRERMGSLANHLSALSPLSVLSRGYAVCLTLPNRELATSYLQFSTGDMVEVLLGQGGLICEVKETGKEITGGAILGEERFNSKVQ